jgi:hypothetical protein
MSLTTYPTLILLERRFRQAFADAKSLKDVPSRIRCSPDEMSAAVQELSAWNEEHYGQRLYHATKDGEPLFYGCALYCDEGAA